MVLLCINIPCQYFSDTVNVFHNIHQVRCYHFFIVESCWKCQFDTDVKIENYNHHDGEQLLFLKKSFKKSTYQNTEQEEGYSCNLCIIAL